MASTIDLDDTGPVERELKFAVSDLEALRERLREMAAERQAPATLEDNLVFDQEQVLERQGHLLRLRSDGRGATLTFKGPARFEGGLKIRAERETRLDNATEAQAILEALGYQVVRRYQKLREEWRLGSVQISLDHTPIGDFVEFEGEKAEAVARRCGLAAAQAETRTYLRLYLDYLSEHPEAPPDMTFRE
jgi:adenylate cyclase class 2